MRTVLLLATGCAPGAILIDDAGVEPPGTTPSAPAGDDDDDDDGPPATTGPTGPTGPTPDYSAPGPYAVEIDSGRFDASCSMAYTTFVPVGRAPEELVVLAHGWLRAREYMAGTAENVASWGVAVVTPDVCHLELVDLDYDQNARDLADLGAEIGGGAPVVHAGHSAGGLSSFLAAGIDPLAIAHVGLDLVDNQGRGAAAAADLAVPAWGLLAEPELCNDGANGDSVYANVPDGLLVKVNGADHCDFEVPSDWGCAVACAEGPADDEVVTDAVVGLVTAAVLALTGVDPRGAEYWLPGEAPHDALVADGVVSDR